MVSKERKFECIMTILIEKLACVRLWQEKLVRTAELMGFSLRDVDCGLAYAIAMSGGALPCDVGPISWHATRGELGVGQAAVIEDSYRRIIEDFPIDLMKAHAAAFR